MTTWTAARDAIATILEGVSITSPIETTIKKVYKYRDDAAVDFPCVVMPNPPGKKVERGPSGYRTRTLEVLFQVLARDADINREAEIMDALEEAIITAFDSAVTLNLFSGYHVMAGPDFEPAGRTPMGANSVPTGIVNGMITLKLTDGTNFIG